jgi:hypothetical protein
MATAKTDPTPTHDTASKASSNWLSIVKDVFPRWRDRLGSAEDAKAQLEALLCDPETRSANHKVDASGEEIPNTSGFLNAEFWPDRLLWKPDADGGDDHLVVDYTDSADVYLDFHFPGGHWEFYVRRRDVERHERQFPGLAAPPTTVAAQDALRPIAGSREQQLVQEIAATIFPVGYSSIRSNKLYKDVTDEQLRRGLPISKRDVVMRALGRRKD